MTDTHLSLWKGHIPVAPRELMATVLAEVAARRGLTVEDLTGPRRLAPIAAARQEAMWEIRHRTPLSLPEIGRRLGGRDHTTVLHGVRQHAKRLEEAQMADGPDA